MPPSNPGLINTSTSAEKTQAAPSSNGWFGWAVSILSVGSASAAASGSSTPAEASSHSIVQRSAAVIDTSPVAATSLKLNEELATLVERFSDPIKHVSIKMDQAIDINSAKQGVTNQAKADIIAFATKNINNPEVSKDKLKDALLLCIDMKPGTANAPIYTLLEQLNTASSQDLEGIEDFEFINPSPVAATSLKLNEELATLVERFSDPIKHVSIKMDQAIDINSAKQGVTNQAKADIIAFATKNINNPEVSKDKLKDALLLCIDMKPGTANAPIYTLLEQLNTAP